jgi:protein TonB
MKKYSFFLFLLISLLVHLIFFGGVSLFPQSSPKNNYVSIDYVSSPQDATPKNTTKPADPVLKQIVDQQDKALNSEESKNAKFLSKNTQSVNKETVARNRGEFRNSQHTHPGDNNKDGAPKTLMPPKQAALEKKSDSKKESSPDKAKPTEKLAFDPLADSKKAFKNKVYETISGATPSNSKGSGNPSQTQDYLKNTELGVETILNTKEFKYYTYFNRIRKQLSQHWEPKVRDKLTKMFRQGRTIASEQDRITKLLIVLNPLGVLVKVQVLSDSGVRDLDDAAIEAFKAAAPFPNPPMGIVDPDGTVKIRWDFILES